MCAPVVRRTKMKTRSAAYMCGGFLLLMMGACAPSTTAKPDGSGARSADATNPGADARSGEGERGATKEANTGSSSLKDMQEGKPPITPASSPLKDVMFDFDRYDLSADARTTLRANADWLRSNPSARVEIEGHCDE